MAQAETVFFGLSIGEVITIAGIVVAALVAIGLAVWGWARSDLKEELSTEKGRNSKITQLENKSRLKGYQNAIAGLNARFDGWFGPNLLGEKAYLRCVTLAFLYPLLFVMMDWVFGASGRLHGVELFRHYEHWYQRLGAALVTVPLLAGCFFEFKNFEKITEVIDFFIRKGVNYLPSARLRRWISRAEGLIGAVAGAVAVAGDFEVIFIFGLFYLLLPVTNALLDMLSWGATRYFLRGAEHHSYLWIFIGILADTLFALVCLVALAFLIPLSIEVFNLFLEWRSVSIIDWRTLLEDILARPWYQSFVIWGMLATTLIPTFIHLSAGFSGLLATVSGLNAKAAQLIKNASSDDLENNYTRRHELRDEILRRRFGIMPISMALTGVLLAGLVWLVFWELDWLGFTLYGITEYVPQWTMP